MDSAHLSGSSSSVAGYKIRYCHCGRRMSTLTCVFHSICINVVVLIAFFGMDVMGVLTFDDVLTNYVSIASSLKLSSDIRIKDPILSASAIGDPPIVRDTPSSVDVPIIKMFGRLYE